MKTNSNSIAFAFCLSFLRKLLSFTEGSIADWKLLSMKKYVARCRSLCLRKVLQSFCTGLIGGCVWERTRRSWGTSLKEILHSGYVFLGHWGCYQHLCDLFLLPLGAWEDIRDHQNSAAGTDSSGHPRGWLCHRKGRVPSARAMHSGGLCVLQICLGAASSFLTEQMGAAGKRRGTLQFVRDL